MTMHTAHPFLVAASRDFEYTTVATPDRLPVPVHVAPPDNRAGAVGLWRRGIQRGPNGPCVVFYRDVVADPGKDGAPRLDKNGRPIWLCEGFVIREAPASLQLQVRTSHLAHLHELLLPCFDRFWELTRNQHPHGPEPIRLQGTFTIDDTAPLEMGDEVVAFEDTGDFDEDGPPPSEDRAAAHQAGTTLDRVGQSTCCVACDLPGVPRSLLALSPDFVLARTDAEVGLLAIGTSRWQRTAGADGFAAEMQAVRHDDGTTAVISVFRDELVLMRWPTARANWEPLDAPLTPYASQRDSIRVCPLGEEWFLWCRGEHKLICRIVRRSGLPFLDPPPPIMKDFAEMQADDPAVPHGNVEGLWVSLAEDGALLAMAARGGQAQVFERRKGSDRLRAVWNVPLVLGGGPIVAAVCARTGASAFAAQRRLIMGWANIPRPARDEMLDVDVGALAFAPDGSSLLVGCVDGRVLRAHAGRARSPLRPVREELAEHAPDVAVKWLQVLDDGTWFSSGEDSRVLRWPVSR